MSLTGWTDPAADEWSAAMADRGSPPHVPPMVLATASTGNFKFQALGRDEHHAEQLLLAAWAAHAHDRCADQSLMSAMITDGDVNFASIAVGTVTLDGELFISLPVG